ncbi:wax ester/triacylglycerol synthase family O-acyltransferase [Mycobacterium sp. Y57]|nr:wax ester/triacylglycerol synthase family O-acyltransferase [Mycolicibacterium xanthum]
MSGLDDSFLSLETATQPLQVFCVIELDTASIPGGYTFDRFRDAMATRLRVIPEFREKLSDPLLNVDFPVWVPDGDFDINNHVHRIGLPPPGRRAELEQLCGYLAGLRLDHSRPLWEMWVIEGLDGGGVAVMLMLHHAIADGVTFADILSRLCSDEPDPPTPALIQAAPRAGTLRIVIDGLVRFAGRPRQIVRLLPPTMRAVIETVRRVASGRAMALPFTAARTVLNGRMTSERRIALARLDLDDVKKVARHFGVKVNDVAMALVGRQVRQFFIERGELPRKSLIALVPVGAHEDPNCPAYNQVSGIFGKIQTQIEDPAERLRAVAAASLIAKEHSAALGVTLLNDWGQVIGPVLLGIAKRVYARLTRVRPMYNVVVSNVPGPPHTRHFLGAGVSAIYMFGPVMHGVGINVSLFSTNGALHVAVISCPALLADPRAVADGVSAGLNELLAEIDGPPTISAAG